MAGAFSPTTISMLLPCTALSNSSSSSSGGKHAHRLLSSLHAVSGDPAATDRLIRKFVAASSKSVALQTLTHLLSSSTFALPMYRRISEARWFRWNPKLVAGVVALLEKHERYAGAKTLISESVSRLKPRELVLFYCDLIEAYSEHGLKNRVFDTHAFLDEIPFAGRRAYESMIRALCQLDSPAAAEDLLKRTRDSGSFQPSPFEFRLVIQAYGRLGLFPEMRMVLENMEMAGFSLDTVSANLILACYGDHGELSQMVSWLGKMREWSIPYSLRTCNSVLNSCPTVCSMLQDPKSAPLSVNELVEKLKNAADEALLVQDLLCSEVLAKVLEWSPSEGKLDLHGCHLGTALIILLQWVEELKTRMMEEDVPFEISVVCGSGKHRSIRGESPIKTLVSEMMFQMKSPLRIDRKNAGRFVTRGKAVRDWLPSLQ